MRSATAGACGSSRRLPRPRLPPACSFFYVGLFLCRIIEPGLWNMRSATAGACGSSRRTPRPRLLPACSFFMSGRRRDGPPAPRTWCFMVRKSLIFRREAPRPWTRPDFRRRGRGASWSANPYSFVGRHHVLEPIRAFGAADVVFHTPQILILSSGGTTPFASDLRRPIYSIYLYIFLRENVESICRYHL